jgi:hypothetical protein
LNGPEDMLLLIDNHHCHPVASPGIPILK